MTSPSDPTVRVNVPPTQPTEVSPEVAKAAEKLVRTKSFLKSTFSKVGVPVLIGATSAFVAARQLRQSDDTDPENDDVKEINE